MAEMKNPNAHAQENRNDTPRKRKTHIIKVRVTAEEKLRIAYACKKLHLTQSELVRRVLYGVNVKHTVVVAQGGEDALAALAALSAHSRREGQTQAAGFVPARHP
ncbi:plasmid mobilization protein [Faecalibacterium duncaniae]